MWGVYHNIKCGQEEGNEANTPFIKKTCYYSRHCLISNESKERDFFSNTFGTKAFTYKFISLYHIARKSEERQSKRQNKGMEEERAGLDSKI